MWESQLVADPVGGEAAMSTHDDAVETTCANCGHPIRCPAIGGFRPWQTWHHIEDEYYPCDGDVDDDWMRDWRLRATPFWEADLQRTITAIVLRARDREGRP